MCKLNYFRKALEKKYEQKHHQQLRAALSLSKTKSQYTHFNTSDYLGLSTHPYVKQKAVQALLQFGAGSSSNRPLNTHLSAHTDLQKRFNHLIGAESTLLFPTAVALQTMLFTMLANLNASIFIEHSYPTQNIKRIVGNKGTIHFFDHNHIGDLPDGPEPKVMIAPSVCPTSGRVLDLRRLMSHAAGTDSLLIIDDSLALGMLGEAGMGCAAHKKGVDIVIGSFGKLTGSFGAYLSGPNVFCDYCMACQDTGPLNAASLGAMNAALDLIPDMEAERTMVRERSTDLRKFFANAGYDVIDSHSHIVSIQMETNRDAMSLSENLADERIIAMPTSLPGLVFNLSATHTPAEMKRLQAAMPAHALV